MLYRNGRPAKWRVEECVSIDINDWIRDGDLDGEQPKHIRRVWRANTPWYGRPCWNTDEITVDTYIFTAQKLVILTRDRDVTKQKRNIVVSRIQFSQSELAWGPSRWWFQCPHPSYNYEAVCGRRVRNALPDSGRDLLWLSIMPRTDLYELCGVTRIGCDRERSLPDRHDDRKRYQSHTQKSRKRRRTALRVASRNHARRARRKAKGWS